VTPENVLNKITLFIDVLNKIILIIGIRKGERARERGRDFGSEVARKVTHPQETHEARVEEQAFISLVTITTLPKTLFVPLAMRHT
jgi:hypothetical protein